MDALVLGGSGLVGKELIGLLLEDDRYDRIVTLSRRSLPFEHRKLKNIEIDFSCIEQWAQCFSAEHLFCCLGTNRLVGVGRKIRRKHGNKIEVSSRAILTHREV